MDPLSGLLGITGLSIASLAFLRLSKQQREGFDTLPVPEYQEAVRQGQETYNPLSQELNPFANTLLPAGSTAATESAADKDARAAFGGLSSTFNLNNTEFLNVALSRYFSTEPRNDKKGGLVETIQFCREQGKVGDPFSDARFSQNCGVCISGGTDEEGNTFTGRQGMFIYEKEKQQAVAQKQETGTPFTKAKPSLGVCAGAPDQPVFATSKSELTNFTKRKDCMDKKVVGDGCGVCFRTSDYSYIEPTASKQSVFLVLAGKGKLTAKVDGTVVGSEGTALSESRPLRIDLGKKEGSPFELKVVGNPTDILLYGYLEAQLPNSGYFRVPIQRILSKDEETGSTPSIQPPSYMFQDVGMVSSKFKNANTKTQLRLTGTLPFSFPSAGEFVTFDCPSNPFQTEKTSLAAISDDPCAKKTATGYSDECLLDKIYGVGCTNGGTLSQTPSLANQYGTTLDSIVSKLQAIQKNDGITEAESKLCSGRVPSTPCEAELANPSLEISSKCLNYLYRNKGLSDTRIGPTYIGNEGLANRLSDGTLMYCIPSGTLAPIAENGKENTTAINLLRKRGLEGFNRKKGIAAVQDYLNSVFAQAIDSTKRTDEPTRAIAIQQCFQSVSNIPSPALASVAKSIAKSLWITGKDGFIYNYSNGVWSKKQQTATQIAVTSGNLPWYVTSSYLIYKPSGSGFAAVVGAAEDIGVGADNTVWVIGRNPEAGGYGIYKFTGSNWTKIAGSALRIAVNPSGNAWVINKFDNVYERKGNSWEMKSNLTGKDIGIGANGTVFVLTPTKLQSKTTSDTKWTGIDPPTGKTLSRVAVDYTGLPYVVTTDNKLYQYNGTLWYEIPTPAGVVDVGLGTT